jgi:NADH-ubiquinone oxidoreductase chain 2
VTARNSPSFAGFSLLDNADLSPWTIDPRSRARAPGPRPGAVWSLGVQLPKNSPIQYISHINQNSNIQSNPALALTFAITLFSMAGTPPLLGFFAKLMVLYAAGHAGYFFLVGVAIMASVISAAYYLRVIRVIFFDTPQFTDTPTWQILPEGNNCMVIGTITLSILFFIANPLPILNCLHLLALSLFYW